MSPALLSALDVARLALGHLEFEAKEDAPGPPAEAAAAAAIRRALRATFRRQLARVLGRLPRDPLAATPADLSVTDWTDAMTSAMTPLLRPIWDAAGRAVMADLGLDLAAWRVVAPTLAPQVRAQAFHFADSTNATTSLALADAHQALRDALTQGLVAEGRTLDWFVGRVRDVFRDATEVRARTIAETEAARAQNLASLESARRSGVVATKRLLLSSDACPRCHAVKASEPPGGWPLDATMHDDGRGHEYYSRMPSPPLHPRCRCSLLYALIPEYDPARAEAAMPAPAPKPVAPKPVAPLEAPHLGLTRSRMSTLESAAVAHRSRAEAHLVEFARRNDLPPPTPADLAYVRALVAHPKLRGSDTYVDDAMRARALRAAAAAAPKPTTAGIPNRDPGLEPTRDHAEMIRTDQDRAIATLAAEAGMTPAAYRGTLDRRFREATARADLYIRLDSGDLHSVLSDGRFKNQLETNTTHGTLDPKVRRRVEEWVLGTPEGTAPAARPIYGYVSAPGFASAASREEQRLEIYGDAVVRLKPSVRARTTVTASDSLSYNERVQGTPLAAADSTSIPIASPWWAQVHKSALATPGPAAFLSSLQRNFGYVEAQFHAGIRVEDIAEIGFNQSISGPMRARLDAAGIPYRVIKTMSEED